MEPARALTLLLFVAHLMIRAAAAPHCLETTHGLPSPDLGSRPHLHLDGHGHHHHRHREHGARRGGDRVSAFASPTGDQVATLSSSCSLDDDSVDVSISEPMLDLDERRAWLEVETDSLRSIPELATIVCPESDGQHGQPCRFLGNSGGIIHRFFPHVLRI